MSKKRKPFKFKDSGYDVITAGRVPGGRAGAFRAALNQIVANTPNSGAGVVKASKRGDS